MMDAEKAYDRMKSVIPDGYAENPGDLRRDALNDGRVHAAGPDVVSASYLFSNSLILSLTLPDFPFK